MDSLVATIALLTYMYFFSGYQVVEGLSSRHVVTTIKTKHGDTYDCVDIYKQPSLDHPLLKNHTIQLEPDVIRQKVVDGDALVKNKPRAAAATTTELAKRNTAHCPKGTVPILRRTKKNVISSNNFGTLILVTGSGFMFSGLRTKADTVKGVTLATTKMSVWNPAVLDNQSSSAGMTLSRGESLVQAGWTVNPIIYGDHRTRFYSLWTGDNFHSTGCYSTHCSGFIVTSQAIALDHVYESVSKFRVEAVDTSIRIWTDSKGNWWLQGDSNQPIGYWPKELFSSFGNTGASEARWGGEVYVVKDAFKDDAPIMGSGEVVKDRYTESAYFENIVFDDTFKGQSVIPDDTTVEFFQPNQCYYAAYRKFSDRMYNFLYGGPLCQV